MTPGVGEGASETWRDSERRQESLLERHVFSILAALILAGIIGLVALVFNGYNKFSEVAKEFAGVTEKFGTLQVHLTQIDERMVVLQAQVAQTYRADDAKRDTAERERQIADLNQRLHTVEASIQRSRPSKELSTWQRN